MHHHRHNLLSIIFLTFAHLVVVRAASVIEFAAPNFEVSEIDGTGNIWLTCTPAPTELTQAKIARGGTATEGIDFELPTDIVQFRPGDFRAVLQLRGLDDGIPEPDETVDLIIERVTSNAALGARTNTLV